MCSTMVGVVGGQQLAAIGGCFLLCFKKGGKRRVHAF